MAVLVSFSKLVSLKRLAHPNLKNKNNLQANKWQTYAIAILATPTSGHLIQMYNMSKKIASS
jgi:hypothetical protein